jgi:hypothetical protein
MIGRIFTGETLPVATGMLDRLDPNAVIASICSVIVATFVYLGVLAQSKKPDKNKTRTPEGGDVVTAATFDKAPYEVIQSLLGRMAGYEERESENKQKLTTAEAEIEAIKIHQTSFSSAVKRYLMKLAAAWKGPEPMPWPDEADLDLLHKTLPYHQVGSHKKEG